MLQKDLEKIYSGWLGKNIGIRLGAPIEGWTSQQIIDTFGEISQFTRYKGLLYLEEGMLHLSCGDEGAAYTGRYDWKDYSAAFTVTPITGEHHLVNIRVQGAQRCYAAGFLPNGRFAILKKNGSYVVLAETSFRWEAGKTYTITLECKGNAITASVDDVSLSVKDAAGWENGCLGISVSEGSHMACSKIIVEK